MAGWRYANQLLPPRRPTDRDFRPSGMGALGITGEQGFESLVNKAPELPFAVDCLP
ncbi:aconitase subunit 1 [Mycolicibacterium rhodesiae JS60]|nr:aconitase subunit 1 [Mycolicibacterium rhodesiae JS60]